MLPQVDFAKIRGHGPLGSQADGFEEVVCELMETVSGGWPIGTRVERFGNPDAGREGRALLPSGETWAWQAKYLFRLDSSAFTQIDKSVRETVEREEKLARLYVALPYDRPAGEVKDRKSAHQKWSDYVEKWQAFASQCGRDVAFEYVGLHDS